MTLPIIYIEWFDTVSDSENKWKSTEDTNNFFNEVSNVITEVGFLWKEDEEYLYLISRYIDGDNVMTAQRVKIPKAWIKVKQIIKYGE